MNKKGIALIFVLGVVSVLLLISLSYVFLVSNELSTASRIHNEVQAYYYAEAAIAKKIIELKSLKYYLLQYRNIGIFYEHVVNRILDDLVKMLKPKRMEITGEFTARGGITTRVTAALVS